MAQQKRQRAWLQRRPGYGRRYYNREKSTARHRRYLATPRGRFAEAKTQAKKHGKTWSISFDDWWVLIGPNVCVYCTGPINVGSGLDRIDQGRGYDADNVVPCCFANNIERGTLSFAEYWMVIESRWERLEQARGQEDSGDRA